MNALANRPPSLHNRHPENWRSRLMSVFPEDEGELVLVALKMPEKFRDRLDAVSEAIGKNRTQTMLSLMRWALDEYDAQRGGEKPAESKTKGRAK